MPRSCMQQNCQFWKMSFQRKQNLNGCYVNFNTRIATGTICIWHPFHELLTECNPFFKHIQEIQYFLKHRIIVFHGRFPLLLISRIWRALFAIKKDNVCIALTFCYGNKYLQGDLRKENSLFLFLLLEFLQTTVRQAHGSGIWWQWRLAMQSICWVMVTLWARKQGCPGTTLYPQKAPWLHHGESTPVTQYNCHFAKTSLEDTTARLSAP